MRIGSESGANSSFNAELLELMRYEEGRKSHCSIKRNSHRYNMVGSKEKKEG